ncbi:hypothetical protein [Chishuiella changwenlii]|uniref:RipA family octameric membrane protein n=1 Tax=Chishuiella changwenlii TaxID=1434701 RepID=UPI002FDAC762
MGKEIEKKDYIKHLLKNVKKKDRKQIIKEAYKNALDTRKFEIELYWKRATYFWAFIGVIFLALFTLVNKSYENNSFNKGFQELFNTILILSVSVLGYIFSLGWYFVNRGSKVWQKNWEVHIDLLENYINGPLFKTVVKPGLDFWSINSYYPFSVSKVNQILSLFVTFFWFFLVNILVIFYLQLLKNHCLIISGVIITSVFLIILSYLFHKYTVSFMYKSLKNKSKYNYTFINID